MPAVTADTLTLPRLSSPDAPTRTVTRVIDAPSGYEGEGFPVRRAFAGIDLRELDPFIHMDQMGEVEYAPGEPKGTPWHPHRGFETVTYMMDGTFLHQDSHGGGGVITDGGTQWMTAGSGLLHIETPPEELVISGGLFHGVQLWVNLPKSEKMANPRYQNIDAPHVSLLSSADAGALVRLIAGQIDQHDGPGSTHTPITVAHVTVTPGSALDLPWDSGYNAIVYTLSGNGTVGAEQVPLMTGRTAVLNSPGGSIRLAADTRQDNRHEDGLNVLVLGGQPIREPVAAMGPFVMNTKAELMQAFDDFHAGRLGVIPADGIQPFRV